MFVLSHITAFEYWRQASTAPARYRALPTRFIAAASSSRPAWSSGFEKPTTSQALSETLRLAGIDPKQFTRPFHLLDMRNHKASRDPNIRYHSALKYTEGGRTLAQSFLKIGKGLYVPSPELCFLQLATTLDLENLIIAGCELCSSYRYEIGEEEKESNLIETEALSSPAAIKTFLTKCSGSYGVKRARTAAKHIVPNAASPVEFALALLLSLPHSKGGYGFPKPLLNYEIALGRYASVLTHRKTLRADLYWPEQKVDVEYISDMHHAGKKERADDAERANTLGALGIQSTDVTWEQLISQKRMERLAASMRTHLKRYPRALTPKQEIQQRYLRTKILHYLAERTFEQPDLMQSKSTQLLGNELANATRNPEVFAQKIQFADAWNGEKDPRKPKRPPDEPRAS